MAYSIDGEDNKKNAHSPSEYLTVNEQLMYKLAALDAAVTGGFRRLDEKMDRFQNDLHEGQIATNDRISTLDKDFTATIQAKRARIDALQNRIVELETWTKVAMAKVSLLVAGATAILTALAPSIRAALGIANG